MAKQSVFIFMSVVLIGWILQASQAQGEGNASPTSTESFPLSTTAGTPKATMSVELTLTLSPITQTPTSSPHQLETQISSGFITLTPSASPDGLNLESTVEVTAESTQESALTAIPLETSSVEMTIEATSYFTIEPEAAILEMLTPAIDKACREQYAGVVTISDMERVAFLLNTAGTPPDYPEDVVPDGRIDLLDYVWLSEMLGLMRFDVYCRSQN